MTRGCIPYPTIEPQKILTFIETEQKRMDKPDHAPAQVSSDRMEFWLTF